MSNKPQLVIVPGAWHAPFYMAKMIGKLEALGYTVHTQQMPSVGSSNPPKDLSEDVAALDAMVEKAIGTGNDVVVICHSWGGMVTTSGLVGLSKKERTEEGKQGGVVSLGYMAAFLVDKGSNLADVVGDEPPPWYKIEKPHTWATSPEVFYNDLPESEQLAWHAKLQSHSYDSLHATATAASWKIIPTNYLLCEDDLAIPAVVQEMLINGAVEKGVKINVQRIKAGHSPFLSKIDETVKWIRGVAGEVV